MATSKSCKEFILEQLSLLAHIRCRAMMGEYILYYDGILFGGIYDDRLLVKKNHANECFGMQTQIPYPKGKAMYYVENVEDREYLKTVILTTCKGLMKPQ
ncbi:MAG: competence protein TfoX [Erysipelotrichia bacterium]|nr:competence protein TfoX [Erysipelotrichia bacterium]NCC54426.1 competence protein TfoX [Erysipelotrichia bacterium]